MDDLKIKDFRGIPKPMDYIPYEKVYYNAVQERTIAEFGKEATLLDATRAMNLLGNVSFFKKFPDLFNTTKETLGHLYQPQFEILENEFTDFEHGLCHIRAMSAHTSIGESLLKPDQSYLTGMRYSQIKDLGKKIGLDCTSNLKDFSTFSRLKLPHPTIAKMELHLQYTRTFPTLYKSTYKTDLFQADYPEEKRLSKQFFTTPKNSFECRLSHQLIRAVYMDEKFKKYSSIQLSYIDSPINTTTKESYELAFTNKEEDLWIEKIANIVINPNPKKQLQTIVNTTGSQSDNTQIIASEAVKIIAQHYL